MRIVVGFPAGAAGDLVSRALAAHLSDALGQQFVVENRPGASSNIATEYAARAPKDGYTLFLGTVANVVNAAVASNLSFDFGKDFAPIALIATVPTVLVVHPSTGARQRERADRAREVEARPVELRLLGRRDHAASGGCAVEREGRGRARARALSGELARGHRSLAGRTQIMFSAVSVVLPHIRAGTLKALAWAAPKRSAVLPDIPTVAEVGLPELDASIWFGLMAPAGTPGDVLDRLARAINDGLKSEALRGALDKMGYEPLGGTPDDFTRYVAAELKKWTAAAEAAGVQK